MLIRCKLSQDCDSAFILLCSVLQKKTSKRKNCQEKSVKHEIKNQPTDTSEVWFTNKILRQIITCSQVDLVPFLAR